MNSIEAGGSSSDQSSASDTPGGSDSSQTAEDASNRECRGLLDGGGAPSGNIPHKELNMFDPMKEEREKWEKKLGVALK